MQCILEKYWKEKSELRLPKKQISKLKKIFSWFAIPQLKSVSKREIVSHNVKMFVKNWQIQKLIIQSK